MINRSFFKFSIYVYVPQPYLSVLIGLNRTFIAIFLFEWVISMNIVTSQDSNNS